LYQRVFFWSELWRAQPLAVLSTAASSTPASKRELRNSFTAQLFLVLVKVRPYEYVAQRERRAG
jgi:hypothetical protein